MDYRHKGLWPDPANLDNRLSENVQDIRQSHQIFHGSHEKLERGINSMSWPC